MNIYSINYTSLVYNPFFFGLNAKDILFFCLLKYDCGDRAIWTLTPTLVDFTVFETANLTKWGSPIQNTIWDLNPLTKFQICVYLLMLLLVFFAEEGGVDPHTVPHRVTSFQN